MTKVTRRFVVEQLVALRPLLNNSNTLHRMYRFNKDGTYCWMRADWELMQYPLSVLLDLWETQVKVISRIGISNTGRLMG
jgi:hypothetical protein